MEVHHHPHVEEKNFKEYFLEFLMIFLAVTLGFFAENIREHFTEKKNTREYLETFQQELKRNKNILNGEKKMLQEHEPTLDSLAAIFDEGRENEDLKKTYSLLNYSVGVFTPRIETSAYQQMVNSGGLKNINNLALKDTLALYIDQIESYKAYNQYINNQLSNTAPLVLQVMDIRAVLKNDPVKTVHPFIIENDKERRLIVFFFSDIQDQYLGGISGSDAINKLNDKLLKLVNEEIKSE